MRFFVTMNILLVEDNPGDAELFKEALNQSEQPFQLETAQTGETALARLFTDDRDENWPDLILLDINLPGMNGHQILQRLKSDPRTRCLPVIVLSSSSAPKDIFQAYDACANGYVRKPSHLDEFFRIVQSIQNFWLQTVELPTRPLRLT